VAVLSMSKQEFSRLEVLLRVQSGRLRVADACVLIGLQRRQVFRLLRGLKQDGATSLLSNRRGKPSNHQLPAEVRILALSIVRERYADFGPTLAAEKLAEHHGCSVSRETLRGRMIGDGLWQDRRHRLPSPHQPRRRRDCLGELVQIDGSEHPWFEDRGAPCTLLALNIDIICANSPQAKGRMERAFGTLQDRMVKSLPSRRRGSCGWGGYRRLPRRTHGWLGSSAPTTRASAAIRPMPRACPRESGGSASAAGTSR
jgi:hypothetical protein